MFFSQIRLGLRLFSVVMSKYICGTVTQCSYAIEHLSHRCSLCWQGPFGLCDFMLFGQGDHKCGQKNFLFWEVDGFGVEFRFSFTGLTAGFTIHW